MSLNAPTLTACLAMAYCLPVFAQTIVPAPPVAASVQPLEAITVSASPLGVDRDAMAMPVDVLGGLELVLRREATLGDTLNGLPGVHADTFGAGASRPVIRGQTAPRVKVLSDGSDLMDASGVSPDHAITSEPMLAQRIEVLRGPATLLYGGGAIGGVVNVIDSKIPETILENGVEGSAELRGSTGSNERAAAFGLTAGSGNMAVHIEGLKRRAAEYRVPNWSTATLNGSQQESSTGSVGLSWIGSRGFIGMAYTNTQSEYGLVGHNHEYEGCHPHGGHLHCGSHGHDHSGPADSPDLAAPYVRLKSERLDLRGEYRVPFVGIEKIRVRGGATDYKHDEIENGLVSTTFKNRGADARVELEHAPILGWRGVIGLQGARSQFSALGEESFLPQTVTKSAGLFLLEEVRYVDWRFELGARQDWQSITAVGAVPDTRASGTSFSGSAIWDFVPSYSLAVSVSKSQRLPSAQELYANGIHLATNTYELGNIGLQKETSQNIDVSLRKQAGDARFSVSVFHNKVKNYIYANTLDQHEDFRLIEYAQNDAEFTGMEVQTSYRFNSHFTAGMFGDVVRGKLISGNANLPRIPAARAGLRGTAKWHRWSGNLEVSRVFRQNRVADYESETAGYNMVNAGVSYNGRLGASDYTLYLRATNLLNQLAFNHSSFVASAAPLAGRRVTLGVRLEY